MMRKIYTLFTLVSLSLTATAGVQHAVPANQVGKVNRLEQMTSASRMRADMLASQHGLTVKRQAPAHAAEVIDERPEGEVKYYRRTGNSLYVGNRTLFEGQQEGLIEVVYGQNGEVYLKNVVCFMGLDTYVKGTISGNTITVPMGQKVYYWERFEYGAELSFVNVERNDDGIVESTYAGARDEATTEATYTIDGNTITLNGTDANHLLGFVWDDDDSWSGCGEFNTTLTYEPNDAVTPPASSDDYHYWGKYSNESRTTLNTMAGVYKLGNDVYFRGIACGNAGTDDEILPDAWVHGTIDGNEVTIPGGQYLGTANGMPLYLVGNHGSSTAGDVHLTYDAESDSYTFVNAYYLSANCDQIRYFLSFEDENVISAGEPNFPVVVTPPVGLETETYLFTAQSLAFDWEGYPDYTPYNKFIQVGFDGSDVYAQGLCNDLPEAWIKGTLQGNQVTFANGQFFGTKVQDLWGSIIETDHYFTGVSMDVDTYAFTIKDVVMTYDAESQTFTTSDLFVDNSKRYALIYNAIYADMEWQKYIEYGGTPSTPSVLSYNDYGAKASMQCQIPVVDTDGHMMNTSLLYYKFYSDIQGEIAEVEFTPDYYSSLTEPMVEIPFGMTVGYDIYPGGTFVYLNMPECADFNRIGVQSIYYGNADTASARAQGMGHVSEIGWYNIKGQSAVDAIATGKTVSAIRYYNIAGQQSEKPFDGMNIVVRTYTDGTTSVTKAVK